MVQNSQTEDILSQLSNPAVLLELTTELDGSPTKLEPYQIRFLADEAYFRIVNKSRQIGFSTIIGGEVFGKALTRGRYKANIVSINQKEASDKIEIVRNFYHSMPDELALPPYEVKPVIWTDSDKEISFHRPPRTSSIISQPASAAVRGGRKDVYFDEFAHIRDARKLWQAALPAITRGDSRLTIVSTPLGQSGLFHEICTDTDSFPEFSRHAVPWWESAAMVDPKWVDPATGWVREEVYALAPAMGTEERVKHFGSSKLMVIYRNVGDKMSFMTEYEAVFVDETTAYFPYHLILANIDTEHPVWKSIPPGWTATGSVSVGVDLAKERDETVFTVVEHLTHVDAEDGHETITRHVRYVYATQDNYDQQMRDLMALALRVKATRVTIDQTGVGQVFVEEAKREGHRKVPGCRFEGIVFTNDIKEKWATRFKGDLQMNNVGILDHPALKRQIHGIQRTKTESNFYKFKGPRDDYFWSLMLGMYGEGRVPSRIRVIGAAA